jgi:putative phosphoesterase
MVMIRENKEATHASLVSGTMRIGVISDTHGKLRREVFDRFDDVEHILHAGDVGAYAILTELETLAPVTAVWGNTDDFEIRARVPEVGHVKLAGRAVVVVHGHQVGSPTPAKLRAAHPAADIIIYGHTHRPLVDREGGALVLNPGAAGAARFNLPLTVAILTLGSDFAAVEFLPLSSSSV